MVFLQIVIGLTGNYAFFNLLSIALCLLLIDDAVWPARFALTKSKTTGRSWPVAVPVALLVMTMPVNAVLILFRLQTRGAVATAARSRL